MARPRAKIDATQVEKLAELQCTLREIAGFCGCDEKTLRNRFSAEIAKGREAGKISLRRAQWKAALGGNVTAQIWLGKNHLGQSDKVEQKIDAEVAEKRKALDIADVERFLDLKKAAGLPTGPRTTRQNAGM